MEAPALSIDVQGLTGVFTISELYYYGLKAVLAPLHWLLYFTTDQAIDP